MEHDTQKQDHDDEHEESGDAREENCTSATIKVGKKTSWIL